MIAQQLISSIYEPLMTSDTGEEAISMMGIFKVRHLPIVNNTQLLGIFAEEDITLHDLNEPIGSYALNLPQIHVELSDHIYEVMSQMAQHKLSVIPVVDSEKNYVGLITQEDILNYYSNTYSFKEPGTILILAIPQRQYSLAEISRIVEGENAKILSATITQEENTTELLVTLKLHTQDINRVIASLERYEYDIRAKFTTAVFFDNLQDRYDLLMTYLDV